MNVRWVALQVSLNDYLRERDRYVRIVGMVQQFNAVTVIQLRANVVAKASCFNPSPCPNRTGGQAMSSEALFGVKSASARVFARNVKRTSLGAVEVIKGFIKADRHLSAPSVWVWYEDLVRDCIGTISRVYQALHREPPILKACEKAKLRPKALTKELKRELEQEPRLAHMAVDLAGFNLKVSTAQVFDRLSREVDNEPNPNEITFGLWR